MRSSLTAWMMMEVSLVCNLLCLSSIACFFIWIPTSSINDYEWGMLFQILETVGNSARTMLMEENQHKIIKICQSGNSRHPMWQMCWPRRTGVIKWRNRKLYWSQISPQTPIMGLEDLSNEAQSNLPVMRQSPSKNWIRLLSRRSRSLVSKRCVRISCCFKFVALSSFWSLFLYKLETQVLGWETWSYKEETSGALSTSWEWYVTSPIILSIFSFSNCKLMKL